MRVTDLFLALPILPLLLVIIMLWREPLKAAFGEELGIFLLVVFVIGVCHPDEHARIHGCDRH
jgi:peptide/nickel transport system permease protein